MKGYYTGYSYVEILDNGSKMYYVSDKECAEMHEEERKDKNED